MDCSVWGFIVIGLVEGIWGGDGPPKATTSLNLGYMSPKWAICAVLMDIQGTISLTNLHTSSSIRCERVGTMTTRGTIDGKMGKSTWRKRLTCAVG